MFKIRLLRSVAVGMLADPQIGLEVLRGSRELACAIASRLYAQISLTWINWTKFGRVAPSSMMNLLVLFSYSTPLLGVKLVIITAIGHWL